MATREEGYGDESLTTVMAGRGDTYPARQGILRLREHSEAGGVENSGAEGRGEDG